MRLKLLLAQLYGQLETNLLPRPDIRRTCDHDPLSVGYEGKGLSRPHTLGNSYLKHLMIRCRLLRPSVGLRQLEGHPLLRAHAAGACYHDLLVVYHDPELLTRSHIWGHCHHILLRLLARGSYYQPVALCQ